MSQTPKLLLVALVLALFSVQTQALIRFKNTDLVGTTFEYYNDNGFLGQMRFQITDVSTGMSGKVLDYDHDNERFWSLEGPFNETLVLKDKNGKATSKYINMILDYEGYWHLSGQFIGREGWKHYLRQIA